MREGTETGKSFIPESPQWDSYIGLTDDLSQRVWQHRADAVPGFTRKYGVKTLVWFEVHDTREAAFVRECQLKKRNRAWKIRLIEELNPGWKDLTDDLRP